MNQLLLKIYFYLGLIIFVLLVLFDILTIKAPFFGKMGVITWYLSGIYLFAFALKCFFDIVLGFPKKTLFTITVLSAFSYLLFTYIPQIKNISGETTQEINCILNHLKNSPDWGFRQYCHLGYSTRQFYLPAIPSFFSRNQIALNLGGSLYFIMGLPIFSSGVLSYFEYGRKGDLITALLLSFLLNCYYFLFLLTYFEQAFYPFGLTLIIVGLFFHFIKDRSKAIFPSFGILTLYLIFSYTSSLAVYTLVSGTIIYFLFKAPIKKNEKILLLFVLLVSLLSFCFSLKTRLDIKIINTHQATPLLAMFNKTTQTVRHVIFQDQEQGMVSLSFHSVFIFFLAIPLSFILSWEGLLIFFWIWGTIVASAVSPGYAKPPIDFALHRATVIFPVIFSYLAILIRKINPIIRHENRLLGLLLGFTLLTGLRYQKNALAWKQPHPTLPLIFYLKGIGVEDFKADSFYFANKAQSFEPGFFSFSQYFLPEFKNIILGQITFPDCLIKPNSVILITVDDPCYQALSSPNQTPTAVLGASTENIQHLGNFKDYQNNSVAVFLNK